MQKDANEREELAGLQPVRAGVTQPHVLQWLDPTFDAARPAIDAWLKWRRRRMEKKAA